MSAEYIRHQQAIRWIKHSFTEALCKQLHLTEVEAPILTDPSEGVQDGLSGAETAVQVHVQSLARSYEVVHSLAKWKRQLLSLQNFPVGTGIVTQMKALRPLEDLYSPVHSVFVEQWDWEQVIADHERTAVQLHSAADRVFASLSEVFHAYKTRYDSALTLPTELTKVTSEQLLQWYPKLSPKQREHAIARECGAVFIQGIGGKLSDGSMHDTRAPDYDDWALNGDLLVWNPVLERSLELSSMGVRVNGPTLKEQVARVEREELLALPWHQRLLAGELSQTVGGGIGQSRVVMWMMQQPHIGCVQASVWPAALKERYALLA
ncbi:aspartate--ammonia ligase [Aliidiomarina celeris]|uniref:aspartate--ammonia ligase n=1 Tax=Aliidiomarina celeris TaxID=2249428 RepID=UPI000DEB624F|nr:aspartate--ammonia ligase [Aliidiomarina celeris]